MRLDTTQHTCDCGLDGHVAWMACGVIEADGAVRVHHHIRTTPQAVLPAWQPSLDDVVVCVDRLFTGDLARRARRGGGPARRPGPRPLQAGHARRQRHARPP
jgi:hypothetical protein